MAACAVRTRRAFAEIRWSCHSGARKDWPSCIESGDKYRYEISSDVCVVSGKANISSPTPRFTENHGEAPHGAVPPPTWRRDHPCLPSLITQCNSNMWPSVLRVGCESAPSGFCGAATEPHRLRVGRQRHGALGGPVLPKRSQATFLIRWWAIYGRT